MVPAPLEWLSLILSMISGFEPKELNQDEIGTMNAL